MYLQSATKGLRHFEVKFEFPASWNFFSQLPPQTMMILLFLRLDRPLRLNNIELRARDIIELRLNVTELKEEVSYGKASFSKSISTTFVASF